MLALKFSPSFELKKFSLLLDGSVESLVQSFQSLLLVVKGMLWNWEVDVS